MAIAFEVLACFSTPWHSIGSLAGFETNRRLKAPGASQSMQRLLVEGAVGNFKLNSICDSMASIRSAAIIVKRHDNGCIPSAMMRASAVVNEGGRGDGNGRVIILPWSFDLPLALRKRLGAKS